jgi:hypothetical protein
MPPRPSSAYNDHQIPVLQEKIMHLESELAHAHAQIQVQQRKWEKLKETVKKKRESKQAIGSASEISISENIGTPEPATTTNTPSTTTFLVGGPVQNPSASLARSPSGSSMYFSINESKH